MENTMKDAAKNDRSRVAPVMIKRLRDFHDSLKTGETIQEKYTVQTIHFDVMRREDVNDDY